MTNLEEKWKKVEEVMGKVSSPQAGREEVARAYEGFLEALPPWKRNIYIATLTLGETNFVKRSEIPNLIRTDSEFYERYKKIILR